MRGQSAAETALIVLPPARPVWTRRRFLAGSGAAAGAGLGASRFAHAAFPSPVARPVITHGVQSGDAGVSSGLVWSRCNRPARMIVDVSTTDTFRDARRLAGPVATEETDYTARLELSGLPPGQHIHYRVHFLDLAGRGPASEPVMGRFRTAPSGTSDRDIVFVWGGDVAGQGWGINPDWGGMRTFAAMRLIEPDFFIHCGDAVYADNPMVSEVALADGGIWRNVLIPEKMKVAETLDEFRGQYRYNLLDTHVRRFAAEVPVFATWDDHETVNNWYPGEVLADDRYSVKNVTLLASRAKQAFREFMPVRSRAADPEQLYRVIRYGPALDIFILDMRSDRGANGPNRQTQIGLDSAILGARQLAWLKAELAASSATWKVIVASLPIGLIRKDKSPDGVQFYEGIANADDGPPLGRELEIADLLRSVKAAGVRNMVWLTADVHYTAAHYYDPAQARFSDFDNFWEFVSGPIHATTGSTAALDQTFGPRVVFEKSAGGAKNLPPSAGLQFFGEVRIAGRGEVMIVSLRDQSGAALYRVELEAKNFRAD